MGLFFSKGWSELSKAEQAWIKKNVTRKEADYELRNSIGRTFDNGAAVTRYILDNYSIKTDGIQSAIYEAVRQKSTKWLDVISDYCLQQKPSFYQEWNPRSGLFSAMRSDTLDEMWRKIWNFHESLPETARLSRVEVLETVVAAGHATAIEDLLVNVFQGDAGMYRRAVDKASEQRTPDALALVARFCDRFEGGRQALQTALERLVAQNQKAHAESLLKGGFGLDINADNGALLQKAALSADVSMMKMLAENGADMEKFIPPIMEKIAEKWGEAHAMTLHLDQFCDGEYIRKAKAAEAARKYGDRYKLVDDDTLLEIKKLPTGGTLTLAFNFATRQQIVSVQVNDNVSLSTVPFSEIEGVDKLEQAAATFVALGGEAKLTEAVSTGIKKQRLSGMGSK